MPQIPGLPGVRTMVHGGALLNQIFVKIGSQYWYKKNYDVDVTAMGYVIPTVTVNATWGTSTTIYDSVYASTSGDVTVKTYAALKAAAMCCYQANNLANKAIYGLLYNWYALQLMQVDFDFYKSTYGISRGLRIPIETNYVELYMAYTNLAYAGGHMKEVGTTHWAAPNAGADNSSGFTALPSGNRDTAGNYGSLTQSFDTFALNRRLYISNVSTILNSAAINKVLGLCVRPIKDIPNHVSEGDSITWQDKQAYAQGPNTGTIATGYQTLITQRFGYANFNNGASGYAMTGVSGSVSANILSYNAENYLRSALITVFAGTNDFKLNKPLGVIGTLDQATFYGAYRLAVQKIKASGTTGKIVLFTPLQRNNSGYTTTSTNTAGFKLSDYCNAIKAIAAIEGVQVIDLYNTSGITEANLGTYTLDGLHPNDAGYILIFNAIMAEL